MDCCWSSATVSDPAVISRGVSTHHLMCCATSLKLVQNGLCNTVEPCHTHKTETSMETMEAGALLQTLSTPLPRRGIQIPETSPLIHYKHLLFCICETIIDYRELCSHLNLHLQIQNLLFFMRQLLVDSQSPKTATSCNVNTAPQGPVKHGQNVSFEANSY